MYKINDYVVYKKDVCIIKEIKSINGNDYYVLNPIDDKSLIITIPITTSLRSVMNKKECEKLIKKIPKIDIIKVNDKLIEAEYKKLITSGNLEDLVKIIKTTYLRNENRLSNHKKIGEKDDNYFKKAEKLLYNELSIGLGLDYEKTKDYVQKEVESLIK